MLMPTHALLSNTGLIEMAVDKNVLVGGDDFKSGQTKLKSVLVDYLVSNTGG